MVRVPIDARAKIRSEVCVMPTQGESKPDPGTRRAAEHLKKQEHPQTHEEREVKTLVDRIEKKVS